jgi:hypothetical protein
MGKSRPPRKRKPAAPPPAEPRQAEPELPAAASTHHVVVRRDRAPATPLAAQLVATLRLVAERMIDVADAAAEALVRRLEGRA